MPRASGQSPSPKALVTTGFSAETEQTMTKKTSLSAALCLLTGALPLTGCSHHDAPPSVVSTPTPQAPVGTPDQQIQAIQNSNMPPTLKAQQIENIQQQSHQLPNGSPMQAAPANKP